MKTALAIIGGLVLAAIALAVFWPSGGDTLYDCASTLSADASTYHVGDSITLTFTLTPRHEKSVRFYTDMHKNVILQPLERNHFVPRSGTIERMQLAANHPLIVKVTGRVLAGQEHGTLIVDFGNYGSKTLKRGEVLDLWARAYPAVIPDIDSVEWSGSNHVSISFADDEPPNNALQPTPGSAVVAIHPSAPAWLSSPLR